MLSFPGIGLGKVDTIINPKSSMSGTITEFVNPP
jgi:hypothetical protein